VTGGYGVTTRLQKSCFIDGVARNVWRPQGRRGLRSTSQTFYKSHLAQQLPTGLQSATVSRTAIVTQAQMAGRATFQVTPAAEDIETLDQRIQWFRDKFPREVWILDDIDLVGDPWELVCSIQMCTACAISDGSFKDKGGAAGLSILCRNTGTSLTGRHTAQGPADTQSAYQSDLSGILGIQTLVRLLELHYGFTTGGVTMAFGGLSALQQAFYVGPAQPTKPGFDLFVPSRRTLRGVTYNGRVFTSEDTRKTSKLGQIIAGGNNKMCP
jgi:hypothetical protein